MPSLRSLLALVGVAAGSAAFLGCGSEEPYRSPKVLVLDLRRSCGPRAAGAGEVPFDATSSPPVVEVRACGRGGYDAYRRCEPTVILRERVTIDPASARSRLSFEVAREAIPEHELVSLDMTMCADGDGDGKCSSEPIVARGSLGTFAGDQTTRYIFEIPGSLWVSAARDPSRCDD